MPERDVTALLSRHPLVSDQVDKHELTHILSGLDRQVSKYQTGAVVEFGCYVGTTSLFIKRLLEHYQSQLEFHVYDSFNGLPEKTDNDQSPAGEQFKAGELKASRKVFERNFLKAGLALPRIHKAWFDDLQPRDIPHSICYAYLDGDYYESIRDSLKLIETRLVADAIIVVDDYANEALPGAARAVDEWVSRRPSRLRVVSSLAIITLL